MPASSAFLLAALLITGAGALIDAVRGRIPNALTMPSLILAPIAHAVLGGAAEGGGAQAALVAAGSAMMGILVCSIAPVVLWRFGGMGGGDCKLMAVVGGLLGPRLGLEVEMTALVGASLFAMARLAYQGRLLATIASTMAVTANPLLAPPRRFAPPSAWRETLALGPFVFLGVLLVPLVHLVTG